MKILFIYKEDYPWDVRVEKIINSLSAHQHNVLLLCRNLKKRPLCESAKGFNIRRIPFLKNRIINMLISSPVFMNPIWIYCIFKNAKEHGSDVIVVRDLPLVLCAALVAKILRIKIYFDMAECYPEMYRSMLFYANNKMATFIFKNYFITDVLEYLSILISDHIFVMIEESKERLLKKRIGGSKISIVSNTPPLKQKEYCKKEYIDKNEIKLLYCGFVTQLRGLDDAIRGVASYYKSYESGRKRRVILNVIGVGEASTGLKKLARNLNVEQYVNFLGWCEKDVVDKYFMESDIGILTYKNCSHWNTTIPNKLFDYMIAGMPVIASSIVPIKRIIKETKCGIVFDNGNIEQFVNCVTILTERDKREQFGRNGYEFILKKYNWGNDEQVLLQAFRENDNKGEKKCI